MMFNLGNRAGASVCFVSRGGAIAAVNMPDRAGRLANVVLGFASKAEYEKSHPYFGSLVGRFSGRIANARFTLDGQEQTLTANAGPHHIAGGAIGFDKREWEVSQRDPASATLRYVSPDGEEGFPGSLAVSVTYALSDVNELSLEYEAVTDRPTALNLTNHSYFNLAGEGSGSIEEHVLTITSERVAAVDDELIATGEYLDVAGTPLDFREPKPIGARIREPHPFLAAGKGYDCSYVLHADGALRSVALVVEPRSGRALEVLTTEPSLAFYSGNFLDGTFRGASGRQYRQGDAFTLEPRHLPNSPNLPHFPSTTLRPGETFRAKTVYRFLND